MTRKVLELVKFYEDLTRIANEESSTVHVTVKRVDDSKNAEYSSGSEGLIRYGSLSDANKQVTLRNSWYTPKHMEGNVSYTSTLSLDTLATESRHSLMGEGRFRNKSESSRDEDIQRYIVQPTFSHVSLQTAECLDLNNNSTASSLEAEERNMSRSNLINELVQTEKGYVTMLNFVVEKYMNHFNKSRSFVSICNKIFGNLKLIQSANTSFLDNLERAPQSVKGISKVFLQHKHMLKLYPEYAKIRKSQSLLEEEGNKRIVLARKASLNDPIDLLDHLMRPIDRLQTYGFLMKKFVEESDDYNEVLLIKASNLVERYVKKTETTLLLHRFTNKNIKSKDSGSIIWYQDCKLLLPMRKDIMLYLFENIIVLACSDEMEKDSLFVVDSIVLGSMILPSTCDSSNILHLQSSASGAVHYKVKLHDRVDKRIFRRKLKKSLNHV